MQKNAIEIQSKLNPHLTIAATYGHFATSHSHVNYYVDITNIKHKHMLAKEAAQTMAAQYIQKTPIDTIVCMEGSEIIGAFLARKLAKEEYMSINMEKNIAVVMPEFNPSGQLIFRDNLKPMVMGKNVLLLIATVTTGKSIRRAMECIQYYQGVVCGISAIFSALDRIDGHDIHALVTAEDIPHYHTYPVGQCTKCQANQKLDAIVNSYGYSELL